MQRTLIERLCVGAGSVERDPELASICEHLQRLLSSRRRQALACPSYGLSPTDRLDTAARRSEISKEIRACIEEYEPRLTKVRVEALAPPVGADPALTYFHIQAQRWRDHATVRLHARQGVDCSEVLVVSGQDRDV